MPSLKMPSAAEPPLAELRSQGPKLTLWSTNHPNESCTRYPRSVSTDQPPPGDLTILLWSQVSDQVAAQRSAPSSPPAITAAGADAPSSTMQLGVRIRASA